MLIVKKYKLGETPGRLLRDQKLAVVANKILDETTDKSINIAKQRLEILLKISSGDRNSDTKKIENFDEQIKDINIEIQIILTEKNAAQERFNLNKSNGAEFDSKSNELAIAKCSIKYETAKIYLNDLSKNIALITLKYYKENVLDDAEYISDIEISINEYDTDITKCRANITTSNTLIDNINKLLTLLRPAIRNAVQQQVVNAKKVSLKPL